MNAPLLQLEGVGKSFGGLKAVDNVSFGVPRGSITALIGPNGAGKTTLINLMTGVLPQSSGRIVLDGKEISDLDAARRARAGIARSYQTPQMVHGLSAIENVVVGADLYSLVSMRDLFLRPWRVRADNRRALEQATASLTRAGLRETLWDHPAESLSYGDQRRVEIARSLAQQPSLLLLDEPAAGLNPAETRELGRDLVRLAEGGLTVLLVEHDMSLVMSIAHHIVVVNFGQLLVEGSPEQVQRDENVIAAYLGSSLEGGPLV